MRKRKQGRKRVIMQVKYGTRNRRRKERKKGIEKQQLI